MNARRLSERRGPRNVGSHKATPPAQGRDWRWIVLPAGFLCLVLVLLGNFLWRQDPMGHQEPASPLGLNPSGDRPANTKADVSKGSDAVPLPRVFSPNATSDDCKLETRRVAVRLKEDFPNQLDALQTSATIHWAMGDTVEAVRLWEKCLAMESQFSPAYEGLGRVSLLQGDFERAIAMFRKAIALEPRNRLLTMFLAEALVRANRMKEVVAELTGFIQSGPTPPRAFALLGQAYLELEQYDDALRVLKVAMQQMPDERQVHFALGKAYDHLGQHDKAKLHRDKVEQLVDVYREAGKGRARESGTPDAVFRDTVRAHKDAAAVYHTHGNVDEAELLWRKAAALDPKDVESRQLLAALYDQTGRASQALRIKQQLRDLTWDSAEGSRRP